METEDIDRLYVIQATPTELEEWNKKGLSHIPHHNITEWEKKKRAKGVRSASAITSCFKCTNGHRRWDSADIDLANDAGVYVEYYRSSPVNYSGYDIFNIQTSLGIKVYGIPTRYLNKVKKNPNMIHLKDFLTNKLNTLYASLNEGATNLDEEIPYLTTYDCLQWLENNSPIYSWSFKKFLKHVNHLINKNSLFGKWLRLSHIVDRWSTRNSVKDARDTLKQIDTICDFLKIQSQVKKNKAFPSKLEEYANQFSEIFKDCGFKTVINWSNIERLSQDESEKLFHMMEDVFNT